MAGITAIVAKDKRSHAERALDVLRELRRDGQPPPGAAGTELPSSLPTWPSGATEGGTWLPNSGFAQVRSHDAMEKV